MKAHELARKLLEGPDLPVIIVTGEPAYPEEVETVGVVPEGWIKHWFPDPAVILT